MCSRADPRRNRGPCAAHRAHGSSGSLLRGGKSPPAFGGGAQPFSQTEFTFSPTAPAPRERERERSYRRGTTSRQTTRLVIEISNSPHRRFDPCRMNESLHRLYPFTPTIVAASSRDPHMCDSLVMQLVCTIFVNLEFLEG